MLLCDAADEVGGKLFVLGGGWSHLALVDTPVPMALAVLIAVPWDRTNHRMTVSVKLVTDDGGQVEIEGQIVGASGQVEVGRPPGIKPGSELNLPLAFKFNGLALSQGGYRWELEIDGTQMAITPFRVGEL